MDINNLPANSHRSKEIKKEENVEKKKIDKVVTGKVKTRKKTKASKFTDAFVSENSGGVMEHTVMDILVPAIKNTVLDIVWDGINIMFFGDTKPKGNRGGNNRPNSSYVSYRSYSDNSRRDDRSYTRRSVYEFDDILLESRGEAEDVLDSLDAIIDDYGSATVADLYELVGITGNYTDNNYGWKNLRNADIIRVHGGDYMIRFPKVVPIK